MQSETHHDFSHPLSIHLEPDEDINSSVTVEFSVEQVPCAGDPKVSCYKSNGCIVFEGYCPIDSQIPFSECGIRNIKTDSKQKQNIAWTQESGEKVPPYTPFMHWDVIPKLLQDIINGGGLKMSEQKNQYNERDRDRPTLIFPRLTGQENNDYSSDELSITNDPYEKKEWKTVGNIVDTKKPVGTPVIIDNLQTRSSEALPDAADLVTQRRWERRGAQMGKISPLLQQLGVTESALPKVDRVSAVLAAYTKSVALKRQHGGYHNKRDADTTSVSISSTDTGDLEVDLSEEDANNSRGSSEVMRNLTDAAVGTGRIDEDASECILCGSPLHHRQHNQRTHYAKDASTTAHSSRGPVDMLTHSSTVEHAQKLASKHTSSAEHAQKPKHKSMTKESAVYHMTNNQGQRLRAAADGYNQMSNGGHTKHSKTKSSRQEDAAYPVATNHGHRSRAAVEMYTQAPSARHTKHSKEKSRKQEVTAYPLTTDGQLSTEKVFASTHAPSAEHKQHPKEKHARHEVTAYPVETSQRHRSRAAEEKCKASCAGHSKQEEPMEQEVTAYPVAANGRPSRDAGTSTAEETQMSGQSYNGTPNTFDNEQDVAAYPMTRGSSSVLKRNSKAKDEFTRCTMQHILFPKNNCPYSPSLASLPLDESDIEYIIKRAQLAKSALPADKSLCPMERWQLRSYNKGGPSPGPSRRSSRSRSSG